MNARVRPQTKFAAAVMVAGVVSAASVVGLPEQRGLPSISVDVANASAVTDALSSLGKGVEVLTSLVGIHVDATISVPFEATLALMAAQQHPELAPNVLSYLVQRFVNPSVGPPITAYPWLTEQTAALVASLLPYPLGPSATDIGLVNEARLAFADVFNSVLGRLPDPLPGYEAVQEVMNDTAIGGAVVAGQLAVRAPLYIAWSTVNYLGNVPVNLEASLESAIQTPDQIPGLVSNLVYGLLSPNAQVGLLGQLLDNVVDPFTWLPAPIGFSSPGAVGLANQFRAVIAAAVNGFLATLPAPVTPSALPSATAAQGQPTYAIDAGKGSAATEVVTSASPARTGTVVDEPIRVVEKRSEAEVSTSRGLTIPVTETGVPADAPAGETANEADQGVGKDVTDAKVSTDSKVSTDGKVSTDSKRGGVTVRPGKVEQANGGPTTDHVTHPSAGGEDVKPKATDSTKSSHSDQGDASGS
jgi:hypothetical protein